MNDKKDLTRIQDLSEYLHEDDPETEVELGGTVFEESDENEQEDFIAEETFEAVEETEFQEEPFSEIDPEENQAEDYNSEQTDFENTEFVEETSFSDNDETQFPELSDYPEENPVVANEVKVDEFTHTNINEEYKTPTQTEDEILGEDFSASQNLKTSTTVEADLNQAAEIQPVKESASLTNEIKHFAENYSYNVVKSSGNPAFSILATDIHQKYNQDIIRYIKEYKISGDIEVYQQALEDGMILISHISEYTAILLSNKMSRFGATIKLAPSSVLHNSPNYEAEMGSKISKDNFINESAEELSIPADIIDGEILISTTSYLQGYKIHKYLGVAQDFIILSTVDLKDILRAKELASNEVQDSIDQDFFNSKLLIHEFHDKLKHRLELQAKKVKGNAIIGLQYNYINPDRNTYEISCTGTIVYAVKLDDSLFI